jgi:hypothetical protein
MSRRAASITQADVSRCGRAAKQLGPEWYIEVNAATGITRVMQSVGTAGEFSPQSTERSCSVPVAEVKDWRL